MLWSDQAVRLAAIKITMKVFEMEFNLGEGETGLIANEPFIEREERIYAKLRALTHKHPRCRVVRFTVKEGRRTCVTFKLWWTAALKKQEN